MSALIERQLRCFVILDCELNLRADDSNHEFGFRFGRKLKALLSRRLTEQLFEKIDQPRRVPLLQRLSRHCRATRRGHLGQFIVRRTRILYESQHKRLSQRRCRECPLSLNHSAF